MSEFGQHSYIQIPPDSTGKKMGAFVLYEIYYTGATLHFVHSDRVFCGNDDSHGTVVGIIESSNTAGRIFVIPDLSSLNQFNIGETLKVDNVVYANISEVEIHHFQKTINVGANDPLSGQYVDRKGAAYIRYSEGDQQLDAFGISRFNTPTQIAQYIHEYDDLPEQFHTTIVGSGTSTHMPLEAAVALDVDIDSGAHVQRMTNMYHIYQAGAGQLALLTMMSGDNGKDNVTRRWGYYDGYDGVFFELEGTVPHIVLRKSVNGIIEEERIHQENWNVDRLDGSGGLLNISGVDLDFTKVNIYWMDLAWLGAGRVRVGIFGPNGVRITAHEFRNPNTHPTAYIRTASLPICAEILNTGPTASPSRLKMVCASVYTDGSIAKILESKVSKNSLADVLYYDAFDGYDVPLMSIRAAKTYQGLVNRTQIIIHKLSAHIKNYPVLVKIWKNPTLVNPFWAEDINIGTETASYVEGFSEAADTRCISSFILPVGIYQENFTDCFFGECIYLRADGEYGHTYLITAQALGGDAQIFFSLGLTTLK